MKSNRFRRPVHYFRMFFIMSGAISIALLSMRYASLQVTGLLHLKSEDLLGNRMFRSVFYVHIAGGIVAVLSGVTQFWDPLRKKRMPLHRILGRSYVLAVLVSGLAGFVVAFFAYGGLISTLGFLTLSIWWLAGTGVAYHYIRKKQINDHRIWMLRSYALCFSAVTLRIWLLLYPVFGLEFIDAYRIAAWAPMLANLIAVEIYISKQYRNEAALS